MQYKENLVPHTLSAFARTYLSDIDQSTVSETSGCAAPATAATVPVSTLPGCLKRTKSLCARVNHRRVQGSNTVASIRRWRSVHAPTECQRDSAVPVTGLSLSLPLREPANRSTPTPAA